MKFLLNTFSVSALFVVFAMGSSSQALAESYADDEIYSSDRYDDYYMDDSFPYAEYQSPQQAAQPSKNTKQASAESDSFSDKGFYLKGQLGIGGPTFWGSGILEGIIGGMHIRSSEGLSGRLGAGYQINRYFAIESGASYYASGSRVSGGRIVYPIPGASESESTISNIFVIDLLGSLRLPIGNYFYVAAKAGVAGMHFSYGEQRLTDHSGEYIGSGWEAASAYFIAPKFGLEMGVKINRKISLFVSGSYIVSITDDIYDRDFQPGLSMFSAGLSYTI